ncbi:unnamed protein product [Ectocarpus sp. 6 AP-2014]
MSEAVEAVPASTTTSQYDLTRTISKYLDLHMMFPLLDFVEMSNIYPADQVAQARLDLLDGTNMSDYAMEIYKSLNSTDEDPPDMVERRAEVFARMSTLKDEAGILTEVFADKAVVEEAAVTQVDPASFTQQQLSVEKLIKEQNFTWKGIKGELGLEDSALESYYANAKFQSDCGDYVTAAAALKSYCDITQTPGVPGSGPNGMSALWGRLACEILVANWDGALTLLRELKSCIEFTNAPPLQQLQQRSWLLHWSLFVFFNHANGRDELVTLFFEEPFMQAIQTNCPWLLRYLVTAIILTKAGAGGGKYVMRDLMRVLEHEKHAYTDPVTEFLEGLQVSFDFDGAQARLVECERVLLSDFFLCNCADEFMEAARHFIFETYCRIHHKIDIGMLADKMGMEMEAAEKWIVDLIRGSKLDAKIDSRDNNVIMGGTFPSVYQQIMGKTKDLTVRSYTLVNMLKQLATDTANGVTPDPANYSGRGGGDWGSGRGRGRGRGGGGRSGGRGGDRGSGGGRGSSGGGDRGYQGRGGGRNSSRGGDW